MSKTETLWDHFNREEHGRWQNWNELRTINNGRLQVTPAAEYPALTSLYNYDFTDSYIMAEIVQVPNNGNGTVQAFFTVDIDPDNLFNFVWHNGDLKCEQKVNGGAVQTVTTVPYSAVNHRWWRLREAAGTIYWEVSPDAATWTQLATQPNNGPAADDVLINMGAGFYGAETTPGILLIDNFNRPKGNVTHTPDTGWTLGAVTKGMVPSTNLLWEENWNGGTLDTNRWDVITWAPGTVNQELQQYAGSALTVSGNQLRIRATNVGGNWTSGRIHLKPAHNITTGYVEARVRFPAHAGTWPSFWMLGYPESGGPGVGEIDIIESVGTTPLAYATVHGALGNGDHYEYRIGEPIYDQTQWHTYGADVRTDRLTIYLDGVRVGTMTPADMPADGNTTWPIGTNPFFIVLNFAIGGTFPGPPDGTTPTTMDMFVGRVRVYA